MVDDDGFHSTHPAPPGPDAAPVRWRLVKRRPDPARVRGYTCECLSLVFEDCRAGGLGFIRRYDWSVDPCVITESPRVKVGEAETLWRQVISGQVR
ncbi:hypothetical protein AB0C27_34360 [Nonomuraea sp. NPDC048882]|uniref:hypothetical protein n=1 Tax=unclassified Nonomuraea TaxID=2593643 RepID=UPI000B203258